MVLCQKFEAQNKEKHEARNSKFILRSTTENGQIRNLSDDSQDSNVQIFKTYCLGNLNFGH